MKLKNSIILTFTALVWGISFVSMGEGGKIAGPLSFNGIRAWLGALSLIPVIAFRGRNTPKEDARHTLYVQKRVLLKGGILCGIVLFMASTLQQFGMVLGTEAGKAGFLSACYMLLVPVAGVFFNRKCGINVWIGVAIAVTGLYFLCINGELVFRFSDILVFMSAVFYCIHILIIDHYSPLTDGVKLSFIQFAVVGAISFIPAMVVEMLPVGLGAWIGQFCSLKCMAALFYSGVMTCGVGFTLQIIGQKGVNPTIASMILSLESVFSVLAGWLILGQAMTFRELAGCALIFGAVILAQLKF